MELVDKAEQQTRQKIADNLNQAGQKVTAEEVSAQPNFPPSPLQELEGKFVDNVHDFTEFVKAKAEGSNYVSTTPAKKIISIASIRNKFLGKKAA